MTESSTGSTGSAGSTGSRGGRRASASSRRRVDVLVALAVVLPAIVGLSLGLVGEQRNPVAGPSAPRATALTSATVVCPSSVDEPAGEVSVARSPGVAGGELTVLAAPLGGDEQVDAGTGAEATVADREPVEAETGRSVVLPGTAGPTVLQGQGRAAPGLTAGRGDRLALPECRTPAYDEWLVGIGASARYATTLELVNPDEGEAVVDVALYDESGPVEEPALRGIQVPARGVQRIDLAAAAPRRQITAAHLRVTRGRVSATARNTRDQLGRGRVTTDFLPAQAEPSTENLLLGVPSGARSSTLFVANPGGDEVRARIRLVTADAVFTPTGDAEVSVPPRALRQVNLDPLLAGDRAEGVLGVLVTSDEPLVASARLVARKDLALVGPAVDVHEPMAAVLPTGAKTLLLGNARRTGVVHVRSLDASGNEIGQERVEIAPDRAAELPLPPEAVLVEVDARNTRIAGVVVVPTTGARPGLATLRLRPAETRSQVPAVAPE